MRRSYVPTAITAAGAACLVTGLVGAAPLRSLGAVLVIVGALLVLARHLDDRLNRVEARQEHITAMLEVEHIVQRAMPDDTPTPRPRPTRRRRGHLTLVGGAVAAFGWVREHAATTAAVAATAAVAPIAAAPLIGTGQMPPPAEAHEIYDVDRAPMPPPADDTEPAATSFGEEDARAPEPTPTEKPSETPKPQPAPAPTEQAPSKPAASPTPTPSVTPKPKVSATATVAPDPEPTELVDIDVSAEDQQTCLESKLVGLELAVCLEANR